MNMPPPHAGSFRETLGRHLLAIEKRDLRTLADTVAEDALVVVMSDGKLMRSKREFIAAHEAWFAMQNWTLHAKQVEVMETPDMGFGLFHLDYREPPAVRQESYLTLVFQRRGGKWLMVLDQNTPIK
jgi:ketosteroid isomerase-like protein